jgi:thiamine-phosphate pyrophosphorylase
MYMIHPVILQNPENSVIQRPPRVYPLTDVLLSGLSHAEQVRLLSSGGASLIQLREKQIPSLEFYEQAKAAMAVAERNGVKLIVNDRVDVALAVRAHGVHLGQDDIPPEAARGLLGAEAIIGYSTHNVRQAVSALGLPIDYIAIGPIFQTATKTDTSPVLGLEGLRTVRGAIGDFPLVAIGGITQVNAAEAIGAGADSVAVISALLADPHRIPDVMRTLVNQL